MTTSINKTGDASCTNGSSPPAGPLKTRSPFRQHAPALWRSGIGRPFPVGRASTDDPGNKGAFLRGVHGRTDEPITRYQVRAWRSKYRDPQGRGANPAWVPEPGIVVIDIDQHDDKHGARSLATALGTDNKGLARILGETLHVSGRTGSKFHGHWYYRVPPDYAYSRRSPAGVVGVEIIGPGRSGYYVVAPGAVHGQTGREYLARRGVDGEPIAVGDLSVDDVALLPDALRALIETDEAPRARTAGNGEIHQWLAGLDDGDDEPSERLQGIVEAYLSDPETYGDKTDHHDSVKRVQADIVNSREPGIRHALSQVQEWFEGYDPSDYFDRALAGLEPPESEPMGSVVVDEDGKPLVPPPRHLSVVTASAGPKSDPPLALDRIRDQFPCLDLAALVDPNRPPRRWLLDGVVPEGDHVSIVAPGGTGKSLMVLALAVEAVRGTAVFLGRALNLPPEGKVLYIDMENSEDDLAERFRDLGVRPENVAELESRLLFQHLPDLRGLDTEAGSERLMAILDAYEVNPGDVLVLDSTQRVTEGPENDADTFRDFYSLTAVELKRRGITVIRTDNTGKSPAAGARGSSAKGDDIGYGWQMDVGSKADEFWLTETKHRAAGNKGRIGFTRTEVDGVLRFLPLEVSHTAKEIQFKAAASRVLKSRHDAGQQEGTSGSITQTELLKAVKDDGVPYTKTKGIGWLAEMVKSKHATVDGGQGRSNRTKYYGWRSDYADPSEFEVEGVQNDGEEAY